ncbi:MAG TPA: hypothetical protein VFO93_14505 [Hymenobacter sp.]|uniref:hypothetical protein n=1 Tax=Hymenobacter sp. TaxID=1898978 RepID=UPI002D7FCF9C|nr:hypothetical protein [Hymenobacter sp.]HET9504751.1 hypothetical protein [Hymenobacter sp.]
MYAKKSAAFIEKSSSKHSKKPDARQAVREARKRAQPVFKPGEAELLYIDKSGHEVWRLLPQPQIPGYTYSF